MFASKNAFLTKTIEQPFLTDYLIVAGGGGGATGYGGVGGGGAG